MLRLLLIAFASILLIGCGDEFTFGNECSEDIKLAEFQLTESSLSYFSYDENDTILFEDQDGTDFYFDLDTLVESDNSKSLIRSLCSWGEFAGEWEYFCYRLSSKRTLFGRGTPK